MLYCGNTREFLYIKKKSQYLSVLPVGSVKSDGRTTVFLKESYVEVGRERGLISRQVR